MIGVVVSRRGSDQGEKSDPNFSTLSGKAVIWISILVLCLYALFLAEIEDLYGT